MGERLRSFLAEDAWLFFGVITLPLAGLAGLMGIELLSGIIVLLGWFLLCPLFLFWGEEIADVVAGAPDTGEQPQEDPIRAVQRRYARGEIDEEELERRIDTLLETAPREEQAKHETETAR